MMGWLQKDKKRPQREKKVPAEKPDASDIFLDNGDPDLSGDGNRTCRLRLNTLLHASGGQARGVVMKLHLENFKQLNEILGYDYCQDLLAQIISCLEQVSGSQVYRYIGVEFMIFLRQHSVAQATQLAEEILEQFDRVWKGDGTDCLCTVQIGLCPYPGYADNADDMMKLLDMALNRAAAAGPNQYMVYDSQMQADFIRRQAIAKHLQNAIDRQEVEIRYRPVYNIETKKFSRSEFDMRIFVPGIGMVSAPEFLPIAEDSGQVRAVEYYALEQVGSYIRRLLDAELINETSFDTEYFEGPGYDAVFFSGESRNPDAVAQEILKEARRLKKDGILQNDFVRAKKSVYGRNISALNSADSIASTLVSMHFAGRELFSYLEALRDVTPEDVYKELNNGIDAAYSVLSVILPED